MKNDKNRNYCLLLHNYPPTLANYTPKNGNKLFSHYPNECFPSKGELEINICKFLLLYLLRNNSFCKFSKQNFLVRSRSSLVAHLSPHRRDEEMRGSGHLPAHGWNCSFNTKEKGLSQKTTRRQSLPDRRNSYFTKSRIPRFSFVARLQGSHRSSQSTQGCQVVP